MSEKRARLTVDEIMDALSEMGRDPDAGADRFRALKMLASQEAATTTLPPPMKDGEVVERLARVMKGAGLGMTQSAYHVAFPNSKSAVHAGKLMTYSDATPEMRMVASTITSLKVLYKKFPESKIHGIPKGFPSGRSLAVKADWCREQALKLLVEREIDARGTSHFAMTAADDTRTATDGPNDAPGL